MIPVSLDSVYFAIRSKREWQSNLSRGFAVNGKIDTTSLKCECSCIIAQMLKIFARLMANFPALGLRSHPLNPYAVCLCHHCSQSFLAVSALKSADCDEMRPEILRVLKRGVI